MRLPMFLDNKKGFSLVEILVALVIFVIGILSVVQIFPGGFFAVKHTENTTLGDRLAQMELERWNGRSSNLPLGILGWDPISGVFLTDADPENLEDLPSLTADYNPDYYSDVNKFRHIIAESTKIPVPTDNWTGGSVYILGFGPIEYKDPASTAYSPSEVFKVYGGEMRRRFSPRGLRSDNDYYIDYDTNKIYFKANKYYVRRFVITYAFWQGSKRYVNYNLPLGIGVATPTEVDQGYQSVNISRAGGLTLEVGTESVRRMFNDITSIYHDPDDWSTVDPYEYVVRDPLVGVIVFNPLGYGATEVTSRGREPLTAYIDYDVLDWHIIREERRVPEFPDGSPYLSVRLTLRHLKAKDMSQEWDGSTYGGLVPATAYTHPSLTTNLPYSILAVDMETGEWYTETSAMPTSHYPSATGMAFEVDYSGGIVRFNQVFAGKTFQIYYKAEENWAVQTYKPFTEYNPGYDSQNLGFNQYFVWYAGDQTYLGVYFPRCYEGSSVSVDYSYWIDKNGNSNRDDDEKLVFAYGEVYQIKNPIDDNYRLGNLYYIEITPLYRIQDDLGNAKNLKVQISRVSGVSLGARTIWREGEKNSRWKKINLQTYLTKSGN